MATASLYYAEGRWMARVEAERTGEIDAWGIEPLAAMTALVSAVVDELDARDEELEEVRGVTS